MVTTRSQDRVDASPPVPVNKRRRFSGENLDDSIVIEVPVREAEDIKAHSSSAETESDNEAAPEVISSKVAAEQVRALPNRSLGRTGNKRRRITKDIADDGELQSTDPTLDASQAQEQQSAPSKVADQATASSNPLPAQNVETPGEVLQVPGGESAATDTASPQIKDSNATTSETPAEVPDPSGDVPVQTDRKSGPVESLGKIAGNGNDDSFPARDPVMAVTTAPIVTDPEAATGKDLDLDLAAEAPPNAMKLRVNTPQEEMPPSVEHNIPEPATATELRKIETPQPVLLEIPMSRSAEMDPASSSSPVETNAPHERAEPATKTPPPKDRVAGTPQSTTSGIITPVWQNRTHDTPLGSVPSPSTDTKTKNVGSSRSRPRPKLPLHHQQMPNPKPKPTSLQQYRDRLLNRHPRTATWGPPGFRNTKFVGV